MATREVRIKIFGDDEQFKRVMEEVLAMKRILGDSVKIKIKTDNDTNAGSGLLTRLLFGRNSTGSLTSNLNNLISKIPYIGSALSKLGPASLPVLGAIAGAFVALIGYIGSMASDLVAAGIGIGAFGILAIPTFSKITAAIAGTKGAMKGLSPVQKQVVDQAKALKDQWSQMAKLFAPALTPLMQDLIQIARKLLPDILPLAESAAKALGKVLTQFNRAISSQGFKSFMGQMLKFSGPAIEAIGHGLLITAQAMGTFLRETSGPNGIIAIKTSFEVLAGVIRLLGVAIRTASTFATGFTLSLLGMWHVGLVAFKGIGDAALATSAMLLRAFSHVPGFGFLKGWASAVQGWQKGFDSSMNDAITKVNQWTVSAKNAPKIVQLQANISSLQAKLSTARALLLDPNLTKTRKANIEANIQNLLQEIRNAKFALASIQNRTVYINSVYRGPGTPGSTGGYASGTLSAMPGWKWVGEAGPELMNFRGGEQVMSSARSMAAARMSAPSGMAPGAAGGDVYNIHVSGALDAEAVARQVQTMLVNLKRKRGGVALGLA